ncbi:keratin-associated 5-4 [Fusarium heterosporum]|uniref:Keratin-associated 5-4 n=1 Tax=Fusarium heterosporum TaxID=42747 RepID=A0A8H5T739_FUSHE|nr:keratin-associated 5-4 [Fusarium heterosporum]
MKVAGLIWFLPAIVAAQSPTVTLSPWQTGMVTEDGTCGGSTGFVCSPIWGACCSKDGQCGRSSKFCGEGCQPAAGNCNAAAPAAPGPGSVSPDGSCGGTNKFVCGGSTYGDCCSTLGWCGKTTAHCGSLCDSTFGTCGPPSNITVDGQCGANGKVCLDSGFGDCCSTDGWCGKETTHCGAGCQKSFGTCSSADAGDISTDGFCGKNGKTCKGSTYGDCCSKDGYCGKDGHCDAGCQSKFGSCNAETGISTDGFCGKNGKTCKGSTYGDCCSKEGFCGKDGHCGAGCQTAFGTCKADSGTISTDGRCGSFNGKTCKGSTFGDCCSVGNWCGDKKDHCDAGCQSKFGTCNSDASDISTDGFCGKNGKTCKGSTYGDCCSKEGYCGSQDHCKAGCQTGFGTCDEASSNISTDGNCGKNGKTCKGSVFGDCCSEYGYCGKGDTFCRTGCQKGFGLCTGISSDSECGTRNGKTCAGSGLGNCCSSNGYCGSTASHCGQGCQKGASSACLTKDIPSLDSTCGNKVGLTCAGGPFNGQCCGSTGYCGTTSTHCGTNCQKGFGRCN